MESRSTAVKKGKKLSQEARWKMITAWIKVVAAEMIKVDEFHVIFED